MNPKIFREFQTLIYEKSGISIQDGKEALVTARIGKRLRALSLKDEKDYLKFLKEDHSSQELIQLIDVISTNVTHFFRENAHFDLLENILKSWHNEGQRKFRIWSAASSSGQEPYSIAMTCATTLDVTSVDLKILATDISTRILNTAIKGKYPIADLDSIPHKFRIPQLMYQTKDNHIQISKEIQRLISFNRINLSQPPFVMKGPFDVVFCRNVMIYFDLETRNRLVSEIYRLLKSGGYLIIGHSETLSGINVPFRMLKPSIFLKEDS